MIGWIQTYSGRKFDLLNPSPDDILIEDIAHALSMICRFTGHVSSFYSVAQHSVLVSTICQPKDALWGLLHDASEAYLSDLSTPLKQLPGSEDYRRHEKRLQALIYQKFDLVGPEPPSVKAADKQLLVSEASVLMYPLRPEWAEHVDLSLDLELEIDPWEPRQAEWTFLHRFLELTGDSRRASDVMRRRVA